MVVIYFSKSDIFLFGVWLTSNIFLTEISFYFNEKLSHHLLTK